MPLRRECRWCFVALGRRCLQWAGKTAAAMGTARALGCWRGLCCRLWACCGCGEDQGLGLDFRRRRRWDRPQSWSPTLGCGLLRLLCCCRGLLWGLRASGLGAQLCWWRNNVTRLVSCWHWGRDRLEAWRLQTGCLITTAGWGAWRVSRVLRRGVGLSPCGRAGRYDAWEDIVQQPVVEILRAAHEPRDRHRARRVVCEEEQP